MDADSLPRPAVATPFPVSDHCDGERFFNPGAPVAHTLTDVIRWQLTSQRVTWPAWVDDPPAAALPEPKRDELVVTFVNHATFLLRTPTLSILTDPVFSDRASPLSWIGPRRVRRPGLALEALPRIDVVLVSHNHYDHMDVETLSRIARRDCPLAVTGLGNADVLASTGLSKIVELDWWSTHATGDIHIVMAPAQHFSARGVSDRNRSLWGSFLLRWPSKQAYFAADSGYTAYYKEIRRRYGPTDVALLPIGAYEPRWFMREMHMNPAEAVAAHRDLHSPLSLGMHFGTFRLTDEGIDEPPRALAEARAAAGIAEHSFRVPGFGESFVFSGWN